MLCATSVGGGQAQPAASSRGQGQISAFPTPPEQQSPSQNDHPASSLSGHDVSIAPDTSSSLDAQELLDLHSNDLNPGEGIPSFFEQIMISELDSTSLDQTQLPPTLTTWMPEVDWFGAVDLFSNEFAPTIEETFDTHQVLNDFFVARNTQDRAGTEASQFTSQDEEARKRHAIFQRSPW